MNIDKIFSERALKVEGSRRVQTLANHVYEVKTKERIYFLKVYTDNDDVRECEKVATMNRILKEHVPVPEVLVCDTSKKIVPHAYIILSKVTGKKLSETNLDDEPAFYEYLGACVGKMHTITYDKFGGVLPDGVGSFDETDSGPFETWKEMHRKIVNARLKFFEGTAFEDLIQPIKKYFSDHEHLIDYDITPRLLHIDLNKNNIFVKNNKVSGIIDPDGGFIGHNEEELMRTELAHFKNNEQLRNAFFKGYEKHVVLDEGYEQRRNFYFLSRTVVHIDCIIKFDTYTNDFKAEPQEARANVERILSEKL